VTQCIRCGCSMDVNVGIPIDYEGMLVWMCMDCYQRGMAENEALETKR
jgi:hypothetical protein